MTEPVLPEAGDAPAFVPHTAEDTRAMLEAIGLTRLADLYSEIPPALQGPDLGRIPEGLGEMEVLRLVRERLRRPDLLLFLGAGAYDHHVPAAVWEIATRGEFYSAYTPYQAEASQGTLQVIYEYQSMMTALTGLGVSNASLYDGANALAEAVLMALRAGGPKTGERPYRVLLPALLHPSYREVLLTVLEPQGVLTAAYPWDPARGTHPPAGLEEALAAAPADVVVVPQPNFLGMIEDADGLTAAARSQGARVVALVNPLGLAVLEPPGRWAGEGVDVACGEAQPLGLPLSAGGPYAGFLTCRRDLVRYMPGRLVGRTVDRDGRVGYTLTLQAREQHIRRAKATSNVCTNQGLAVTAVTIHTALLGAEGLRRTAAQAHARTRELADALATVPGVRRAFSGPFLYETVVLFPEPAARTLAGLLRHGILGGLDLAPHVPELGAGACLVCATERRTSEDIARYRAALASVLAAPSG
jgi:glycine dehydrogenase subunit 1